jgi:hypothetical protein
VVDDELDSDLKSNVTQPCCVRCGRELRSPRAQRVGYGPECWTAILTAHEDVYNDGDWSARQLGDALELIRDRGIILWHRGRNTVYRSVGSDGVDHYLTSVNVCNCPAGLQGNLCYHRAAVTTLLKSTEKARSKRRQQLRKNGLPA